MPRHCRSLRNPCRRRGLVDVWWGGWMGRIYLFSCDSGLNILPVTSGISMKSHGNFLCFTPPRPLSSPCCSLFHWCLWGPFCPNSHSRSLPRIQSNHWLITCSAYFSESIGRRHSVLFPVFSKTSPFQPWGGSLPPLGTALASSLGRHQGRDS